MYEVVCPVAAVGVAGALDAGVGGGVVGAVAGGAAVKEGAKFCYKRKKKCD